VAVSLSGANETPLVKDFPSLVCSLVSTIAAGSAAPEFQGEVVTEV